MQDPQGPHHPNYGSFSTPPGTTSDTAKPKDTSTIHHPSSSTFNTPSQTPLSRSRRTSNAVSICTHASCASSASSSWSSRTHDSLDSAEAASCSEDEDEDDQGDCDDNCALDTPTKGRRLFWSYMSLAPILALVVVAFATLLQVLVDDNDPDHDHRVIHLDVFGIGMAGWTISFVLRRPVFAILSHGLHLDPFLCECLTLLAAGVLDESVRLALLSWVVLGSLYNNSDSISTTSSSFSSSFAREDFGKVYWLGLGWASIETLYYLIQSLVFSRWLTREEAKDPEARYKVRQMLGIDLERTSPWWSVMGRVSSLMVHVGLCCWLGRLGWHMLVPAMVVHGSLYLVWGVIMPYRRWSVPATSYGTLMIALSVFLIGLALYGEIV
ncbi:hypothetical protein BGZ73_007604 [Actinomortierella ambigua]|nr:hypothetical protein BGZ73_007604 [Actinomortierella ambigua]